ncbi:hypothetical protein D9M73_182580 [compost metagenome]
MKLTIAPPVMSKQWDAYKIKNPHETQNEHSVKSTQDAAKILNISTPEQINELKVMIKDFDLASTSTYELKVVGRKLYDAGFIDEGTWGFFISGDGAFDENGFQTKMDVKFNAIALAKEKYEGTKQYGEAYSYGKSEPAHVNDLKALLSANKRVGALYFFANAERSELSFYERA